MSAAVGVFDLSAMRRVKAEATDVPNVWRVSLPARPWKFSSAEQERQSITEKLSAALPYRALWLSDWASDERPGWHILARDESLTAWDHELGKGAWVLFFFEHAPGNVLDALVPVEPISPVDAVRQVRDLRGAAAIWSWYDDAEWLVVFPGSGQPKGNRVRS